MATCVILPEVFIQKNESTNNCNLLFISIKGKNVLVTTLLLFAGLKRNPGAWRKHINAVYHCTTNDGTGNSLWKRNE